jgi:Helix-turn-helix domain
MRTANMHRTLTATGVTPLWDTPTTAAFLVVPEATLDQWAYRGIGPPWSKVGRYRRYRQVDVENWLNSNRHGGDPDGAA